MDILETGASPTDEATITGMPLAGAIVRQTCELTGGSGITVDPVIGTSANPSGVSVVFENATPATVCNNAWAGPFYTTTPNTLYHRSRVSGGSDNSIHTVYLIVAYWASGALLSP